MSDADYYKQHEEMLSWSLHEYLSEKTELLHGYRGGISITYCLLPDENQPESTIRARTKFTPIFLFRYEDFGALLATMSASWGSLPALFRELHSLFNTKRYQNHVRNVIKVEHLMFKARMLFEGKVPPTQHCFVLCYADELVLNMEKAKETLHRFPKADPRCDITKPSSYSEQHP